MARDDFAVIIPTHGRAERQITLEMLRKQGYNGEVKFLVDTQDEQLKKYKELYGGAVSTFDKKAVECDTFTNQPFWRSVVYARNEAEHLAKTMGRRFFAMLDDDLCTIVERYKDGGKLRRRVIENLEEVFDGLCDLCACENLAVIGLGTQNMYRGGELDYAKRVAFGAMIRDTNKEMHWKSVVNEDYISELEANCKGLFCTTFPQLAFETKETGRGIVSGGMQNAYATFGEYERSFFAVMEDPSRTQVDGKMRIARKQKGGQPELVSGRWKK